jgi:hypothetical protein
MTVWQIIRLIPLILEVLRMLQEISKRGNCDIKEFKIDEMVVYMLTKTKLVNKLQKAKFTDEDLKTIVNFALLILKLTGKG